MIQITRYPNGYKIEGHSGYAAAGTDIVCAGVSILGQTAVYMLMDYGEYEIDHQKGYLHIYVDEEGMADGEHRVKAIMDTIDEGLSLLLIEYPHHITRKEDETWMR